MLRSKTSTPKPLDQWFNDIVSVSRLREIIEDPTFQLASATLLAAAQPSYRNLSSSEQNSLRQAWLAGYNDFANDLMKLVKAPANRNQVPEEWSHYE
jgi:hypothetical protein